MKYYIKRSAVGMLLAILLVASCKKEETIVSTPEPGNEFLTTIKLRFENVADASDTLWAVWRDLTPEDLTPPDTSLAVANLHKDSKYKVSVYLLDETKSPAEDITEDIKEKQNYHAYFFFLLGEVAQHVTITATDYDTNPTPFHVGLENEFITGSTVSSGRLEGVLRHQPNSKDGTFTPGSTDSDVFFTLNIIP